MRTIAVVDLVVLHALLCVMLVIAIGAADPPSAPSTLDALRLDLVRGPRARERPGLVGNGQVFVRSAASGAEVELGGELISFKASLRSAMVIGDGRKPTVDVASDTSGSAHLAFGIGRLSEARLAVMHGGQSWFVSTGVPIVAFRSTPPEPGTEEQAILLLPGQDGAIVGRYWGLGVEASGTWSKDGQSHRVRVAGADFCRRWAPSGVTPCHEARTLNPGAVPAGR